MQIHEILSVPQLGSYYALTTVGHSSLSAWESLNSRLWTKVKNILLKQRPTQTMKFYRRNFLIDIHPIKAKGTEG